MSEDITEGSTNVFADLDSPYHAKAVEIVEPFQSLLLDQAVPEFYPKLISAITEALQEAVREVEAPLIEKIGELSHRVQVLEEIKANLDKAVKSKPIPWAHDARIILAVEEEREACAKIADHYHRNALRGKPNLPRASFAQYIRDAIRSRSRKEPSDV